MSSLTSVTVTTHSSTNGPLQNAYPPACSDAPSSVALSRQVESASPTPSTPLSLQTAQPHHEAKRPSALPTTPEMFGPPRCDSSSSSVDTRGGGAKDVGIQHTLLQDAMLHQGIPILPSMSMPSQNPFAYTTPEPTSPRYVPSCTSLRSVHSSRAPSVVPSIPLSNPLSTSGLNQTSAPYMTAYDTPRHRVHTSNSSFAGVSSNLSSPPNQSFNQPLVQATSAGQLLHKDARRVLCAFFRAVGDVVPIDLSDTTFLPTPLAASLPAPTQHTSQSMPPPVYQHELPVLSADSSHPLFVHATSFVPSSVSSVPTRVPVLDISWNVLQSIPYSLNMPVNHKALERAKRRHLHLLDCYDLLVQDMGHEDPILEACVRDLLMPFIITQESAQDFYRHLHAAEHVIQVNESIRDGTYQPPDPAQSINTIPTYNTTLNEHRNRDSSPDSSVIFRLGHASHSDSHYRRTARVQSVTDKDDKYHRHESSSSGTPACHPEPVPRVPLPAAQPSQGIQLPPILRPYVPSRQRELNIRYVDRVAFALYENGLSRVDHANISIPDKESNRVQAIDWLLDRVLNYRTCFPDDTEVQIDERELFKLRKSVEAQALE
jgi:hypothetical protein